MEVPRATVTARPTRVIEFQIMSDSKPLLLSIYELGGYPNFVPLYQRLGFEVEVLTSGRKAVAFLKKRVPEVVVAEFNYSNEFRDRTSNLESILAVLQRNPQIRVVVFYEPELAEKLELLRARFPNFTAVALPVEADALEAVLRA